VGFFPNFIYNYAALKNLYFSSIGRARTMSTRFAGDDWSNQFRADRPPRAKSALEYAAWLGAPPNFDDEGAQIPNPPNKRLQPTKARGRIRKSREQRSRPRG